jgi:hypothetical protein
VGRALDEAAGHRRLRRRRGGLLHSLTDGLGGGAVPPRGQSREHALEHHLLEFWGGC